MRITTTANGALHTSCCPAGYNDMSVNLGGTPLHPNCDDVNESVSGLAVVVAAAVVWEFFLNVPWM